jgi:sugar lactone lactonase YvrE
VRDVYLIKTACAMMVVAAAAAAATTQENPYDAVDAWGRLPAGRTWGSLSAVDVDADGVSIWVAERCGRNNCAGSALPPVLKFDPSGKLVRSFAAGMFTFPHGMSVDGDGNVWVTDGIPPDSAGPPAPGKGHVVVKFSPEGKVLLTLGKPGTSGSGNDTFNQPSDVVVSANGDIFVADGHGGKSNARIVRFTRDGRFIKSWGTHGSGPGEFDTPHGIAIDSRGRVFVADRGNNRIQIFDQDGKFLDEWRQFSRPSGLYIDRSDTIYVADSESNTKRHPGGKRGIYVGNARDGKVTAFIPDPERDPDNSLTSGAEGVAADSKGTIYGAEVGPKRLRKYVMRSPRPGAW